MSHRKQTVNYFIFPQRCRKGDHAADLFLGNTVNTVMFIPITAVLPSYTQLPITVQLSIVLPTRSSYFS